MARKGRPTARYVRANLRYEPDTGEFWWKVRAPGRQMSKQAGSIVTTGKSPQTVRVIGISYGRYYAHVLAFLIMRGRWPISTIDHEDTDTLNNRWANLREATRSQNNANRPTMPGRLKGARYYKRTGRWEGYIKINGCFVHLGYYNTREEAHAAYRKAARNAFGRFARF